MSKKTTHPDDPRDLIGESYRIEGIGPEDCRSIFFDWALGLPGETNPAEAAGRLLAHFNGPEDHPMSALLREAMAAVETKRGRTGRRRNRIS